MITFICFLITLHLYTFVFDKDNICGKIKDTILKDVNHAAVRKILISIREFNSGSLNDKTYLSGLKQQSNLSPIKQETRTNLDTQINTLEDKIKTLSSSFTQELESLHYVIPTYIRIGRSVGQFNIDIEKSPIMTRTTTWILGIWIITYFITGHTSEANIKFPLISSIQFPFTWILPYAVEILTYISIALIIFEIVQFSNFIKTIVCTKEKFSNLIITTNQSMEDYHALYEKSKLTIENLKKSLERSA